MRRPNHQLNLFPDRAAPSRCRQIGLDELFDAYAACRKNKRRTMNALVFELEYEEKLSELLAAINTGAWRPGRSVAFIVERPVKREIFAAPFSDRVVHHLLFNKLNPLFEKAFIYDSYSCRAGKGTHLGIRRLERFVRSCSLNHSREAYALKLDIRGFFMSISRRRLYAMLEAFILERYGGADLPIVLDLVERVVCHDPSAYCVRRGRRSDWHGLPPDKSLFHSRSGCGLPIGNLTSQVFANFYLNVFDHFMKHDLGLRWYGRYVDDMVVVHHDRAFLSALVPVVQGYLRDRLGLVLHPGKVVLEPCSAGVGFLGAVVKPRRTTISDRTKGNLYRSIMRHNRVAEDHRPNHRERAAFRSSMNSYLGLLGHYQTYALRLKMLGGCLSPFWLKLARPDEAMRKISLIRPVRRLARRRVSTCFVTREVGDVVD